MKLKTSDIYEKSTPRIKAIINRTKQEIRIFLPHACCCAYHVSSSHSVVYSTRYHCLYHDIYLSPTKRGNVCFILRCRKRMRSAPRRQQHYYYSINSRIETMRYLHNPINSQIPSRSNPRNMACSNSIEGLQCTQEVQAQGVS